MQTYIATYRLRPADGTSSLPLDRRPPLVAVHITDFCLHHAAARAEWRRPTVAAEQGWHPGRTELVAVELAHQRQEQGNSGCTRARRTALQLVGCEEDAGRLLAAATVVAAGDRH